LHPAEKKKTSYLVIVAFFAPDFFFSCRRCFEDPSYFAEWKDPKDFTEILVCPEMVGDHFPDKVLKALGQLSVKNFTPKSRYGAHSANTNV
jgi:hypothetical protein